MVCMCCFHLGSSATIAAEILLQMALFYLPQNGAKLHCSLAAGFVLAYEFNLCWTKMKMRVKVQGQLADLQAVRPVTG